MTPAALSIADTQTLIEPVAESLTLPRHSDTFGSCFARSQRRRPP